MTDSKRYIVEGNTVRALPARPQHAPEQETRTRVRTEAVPAKARVNVPYVLMLIAVTLLFGYLCFSYLRVQASINASQNRIANMEEHGKPLTIALPPAHLQVRAQRLGQLNRTH